MKRRIDQYLIDWKEHPKRKPLLLRGARQVGKTYSALELGKTFDDCVVINFELQPSMSKVFEHDLDPKRIIQEISLLVGKKIVPGKTLLFFDEIQEASRAFTALRYFYELLPELHIIAAGSLLDFTIQELGIPVGRVSSLYVYPFSFLEFLEALEHKILADEIIHHNPLQAVSELVHKKLLKLFGQYIAIGGMPEAINVWRETQDAFACFEVHATLVETYRQDFSKYAKKFQIKYVSLLFNQVPLQLGRKFKYSSLEGDYRKRDLAPALDLLKTAGIIHQVHQTAAQGIPLGAQSDPSAFKTIFLDSALAQNILGLSATDWLVNPLDSYVNKGEIVEALIGQELLAYSNPKQKTELYYWERTARGSQTEVDYVVQHDNQIVPLEVKSGTGSTLRSMHSFLEKHSGSRYGVRFSTQNYSLHNNVHSYPLYAVSNFCLGSLTEHVLE